MALTIIFSGCSASSAFGVMPAWSEEWRPAGGGLTQAEINAVAAYVHQLGGGE